MLYDSNLRRHLSSGSRQAVAAVLAPVMEYNWMGATKYRRMAGPGRGCQGLSERDGALAAVEAVTKLLRISIFLL